MDKYVSTLICNGKFLKAKSIVQEFESEEFSNAVLRVVYDDQSITAYSFVSFLLQQQEMAVLHDLAFTIVALGFFHINGSYETALYHARRLVELDINNVSNSELLLFLNRVPEKTVADEEAYFVAHRILQQDSENTCAKEVITCLGKVELQVLQNFNKNQESNDFCIKKKILEGEFLEAYKYVDTISREKLWTLLFNIGEKEESLCAYTFATFLLLKEETAENHVLAADMALQDFAYNKELRGFHTVALFHVRRALELRPHDLSIQKRLLTISNEKSRT